MRNLSSSSPVYCSESQSRLWGRVLLGFLEPFGRFFSFFDCVSIAPMLTFEVCP